MYLKSNLLTVLAIRALLVGFLTVCCIRGAICFGSDQPPDSSTTAVDANDSSETATMRESPSVENQSSRIPSRESESGIKNTSSDDLNTAGEKKPRRTPFYLSGDFWFSNKMIAFYVVIGTQLVRRDLCRPFVERSWPSSCWRAQRLVFRHIS